MKNSKKFTECTTRGGQTIFRVKKLSELNKFDSMKKYSIEDDELSIYKMSNLCPPLTYNELIQKAFSSLKLDFIKFEQFTYWLRVNFLFYAKNFPFLEVSFITNK
jgi:hypothetical protein